jgi:hypothetical protein
MKFNRKTPDYNSKILVTLILIYPNPFDILKKKLLNYVNILSEAIDFNFSIAILTYNKDISKLMLKQSSQINLKFISTFSLNNIEIPNSKYFSFVTHSRNKIIDVFYTNMQFSKYKNFIYNNYKTSIRQYEFSGYYALGTNFYAYAPSHLALFDFFDFFIKFDHDLIGKLQQTKLLQPFPLTKMIRKNKYFFFACYFMNDADFVTTNLYKTFFSFSLKQYDKCNYTILPKNLYKYKETLSAIGKVNICWLGFYSMLNIRYFSEEYISAPDGLYKNRWGDQQFFIPTLFGYGFRDFSYFNKHTYLCSWAK